jgi:hypothetical protein
LSANLMQFYQRARIPRRKNGQNSSRMTCSAMFEAPIALVLEIFSDRSRRACFRLVFLSSSESNRCPGGLLLMVLVPPQRNEIPTRSLKHICVIFCVFFSLHLRFDSEKEPREGNHKRDDFFWKSPVSLLPKPQMDYQHQRGALLLFSLDSRMLFLLGC